VSTAVQQVVTEARALAHDGYGNHFIIDTLTAQATGAATVFKLNNQNVVQAADGAPSNVVATVNGSTVSVSSVNEQSGQVTLSAAPAAGSLVQIAYYFVLNTDTEFITFCQNAERFTLGVTPTINALTSLVDVPDNLVGAMVHYTAQLAARSMASLAHWYYNGSAGGKTFDKASIAEGWARQAEDLKKEAEGLREDVYTRFDQIKAPAWGNRGLSGLRPWTPPR
jgi:endonuclease YncB( thermonuclease family)